MSIYSDPGFIRAEIGARRERLGTAGPRVHPRSIGRHRVFTALFTGRRQARMSARRA